MQRSHLTYTHDLWRTHLKTGDIAIDATCGRGKDAAVLLDAVGPQGHLYCIDLQEEAITSTQARLKDAKNVTYLCQSHEVLPKVKAHLIVYNLGYLPGGNHTKTTTAQTTFQSVLSGLERLEERGLITLMLYWGHEEGKALLEALSTLARKHLVTHTQWINRKENPSLVCIY